MQELDWIKDLIVSEEKMEESGIIDVSPSFDLDKNIEFQTVSLLNKLKDIFIDYTTVYNKMRAANLGGIKIYGISKTKADFMVFRNGYKLFFAMKKPGTIAIKTHYHGNDMLTPQAADDQLGQEDLIEARMGAFNEVIWTHQEQVVNTDYLVRFYFSRFIKQSTK